MYRKSYIPILLTTAILCSPLQADGWTPAWIVALFKKYQNRATSKSLEQYPVYKEFKERFPQNAPSVVMETKTAEELVKKGILYNSAYSDINWQELKNELRMREFLKEHHITQFNDPVKHVIYEENSHLECRQMRDKTELVGDENSPLKTINQEQLKELVTILTQTGMNYKRNLSVDPTTGKLENWWIMYDWEFSHTNTLSAFEKFYSEIQGSIESEKLWEMYRKDPVHNRRPIYIKRNIITQEGRQWLENFYHTLQKECRNSDGSFNEKCTIVPLPKRTDLEK